MKTFLFIVGILILMFWIAKLLTKGFELNVIVRNSTDEDFVLTRISNHQPIEKTSTDTVTNQKALTAFGEQGYKDTTPNPKIQAQLQIDIHDSTAQKIGTIWSYHKGERAYGITLEIDSKDYELSNELIYGNEITAHYEVVIERKRTTASSRVPQFRRDNAQLQ